MIFPRHPPGPEEIAEHYDSLGQFYRDVWGDDLHHGYWSEGSEPTSIAIEALEKEIANLASISRGDRVLDVGCGYGTTAIRLASQRGAIVTGWTVSPAQQEAATQLAETIPDDAPKPTFLCRDWMENKLADESCDAVLSIECFSHIPDKAAFLGEVARVLKPGGRLAFSDWAAASTTRPWQRRFLLEPICREGRLAGLADRNEWRTMLEGAGLEITCLREIGREVRKTWRIITWRIFRKTVSDPRYRKFLFENLKSDRIFALTILRLLAGYQTGCLEYVLAGAKKTGTGRDRDTKKHPEFL
ncbi:MAG: methyltransferase domain-containing protein [Verrucomicrobiales bacterium]|nr:methyltransferase domain-containing protein [Verrucomicrobiales bacterium]